MDTMERRVHPNCLHKSNPYHECIESCFEKMPHGNPDSHKKKSGSLILVIPKRLSFRKKKELDSDVMTPTRSTELKSPLHRPDSPSSSPVQFSFNKVESWDCDVTPLSDPTPPPDASFLKFLPESMKVDEDSHKKQTDDDVVLKQLGGVKEFDSMRSTVTVTDQSTEESDGPDSRVPIGNYFVKESVSAILPSILNKHGDIAESCKLESAALRSYYLECVCFAILELQSRAVNHFSEAKLKEMLAIVKDAESVGINVRWLSPVVDRIGKVIELIRQRKAFEAEKREFDLNVESVRKELEVQLQVLAEKEAAASMAKARVEEMQGRLQEIEQECLNLRETMMAIESKLQSVDYKSMVGEML